MEKKGNEGSHPMVRRSQSKASKPSKALKVKKNKVVKKKKDTVKPSPSNAVERNVRIITPSPQLEALEPRPGPSVRDQGLFVITESYLLVSKDDMENGRHLPLLNDNSDDPFPGRPRYSLNVVETIDPNSMIVSSSHTVQNPSQPLNPRDNSDSLLKQFRRNNLMFEPSGSNMIPSSSAGRGAPTAQQVRGNTSRPPVLLDRRQMIIPALPFNPQLFNSVQAQSAPHCPQQNIRPNNEGRELQNEEPSFEWGCCKDE